MQKTNSDITGTDDNWGIGYFNDHPNDSHFLLDFCLGHLTKGFIIYYEAGFCQPFLKGHPLIFGITAFVFNCFRSKNPNPDDREIFVQPTCATDTENIKLVDVAVQNTITKAILENVGLN